MILKAKQRPNRIEYSTLCLLSNLGSALKFSQTRKFSDDLTRMRLEAAA